MADLPTSKKPVIVISHQAKPEHLISAAAVYKLLKGLGKEVEFVFSKNEGQVTKLKALAGVDVVIKNDLPPKKYLISFKKEESSIENVQWQQEQDKINIYVTLAKGLINPASLKVNLLGADYDLAILIGVQSLSELGEVGQKYGQFFHDTKLFGIGAELNWGDKYQTTSHNRPNLSTLAEQTFTALENQKMNSDVAQLLMGGIMLETNQLTKPVKSPETFNIMRKLMEKGAKTESVKEQTSKVSAGGGSSNAGGGANSGQSSSSAGQNAPSNNSQSSAGVNNATKSS